MMENLSDTEENVLEPAIDHGLNGSFKERMTQEKVTHHVGKEMYWQNIQSAPKDGTIVFLLREINRPLLGSNIVIGAWSNVAEEWVWPCEKVDEFDAKRWWAQVEDDCYQDHKFTHWMPIPPRPAQEDAS